MILSINEKEKTARYLLATTSLWGITTAASLVYTSVLLYKNLPGLEQVKKLHLVTTGIIVASLAIAISSGLLWLTNKVRKEHTGQAMPLGGDAGKGILLFIGATAAVAAIALAANLIGQIPLFTKVVQSSPTPIMIAGLVLACLPVAIALISLAGWVIGANVEKETASGYQLNLDAYDKVLDAPYTSLSRTERVPEGSVHSNSRTFQG